jgi:predicted nucleic acid-binding protein
VKFWDSSALVQIYIEQGFSKRLRELYVEEPRIAVWWGAQTECVRAFCHLHRRGEFGRDAALAERTLDLLLGLLGNDWQTWNEIEPTDTVRKHANEVARRHGLRSMDAMQLGAALAAADGNPAGIGFVCCDDRLVQAAKAEGFHLVPLGGIRK